MSGWEKTAVTLAVFLPAVGALVITAVPGRRDRLIRMLGIVFTGAALVVGIIMLFGFDFGAHNGLQFELNASWISSINARYHVGIDGISLPLFELTLLLSFLCAIYTTRIMPEGPSAGLHTQATPRSGMTARMPPPTPLLAGSPTR